jgi:uncharacterized protein (TIGR00251 family)
MIPTARLRVRVIPNAGRNGFDGCREGEWILRLNAPAVDGKANKAAVGFIARFCGVASSSVLLTKGESSRHKIFEIVGLNIRDLERKLAEPVR